MQVPQAEVSPAIKSLQEAPQTLTVQNDSLSSNIPAEETTIETQKIEEQKPDEEIMEEEYSFLQEDSIEDKTISDTQALERLIASSLDETFAKTEIEEEAGIEEENNSITNENNSAGNEIVAEENGLALQQEDDNTIQEVKTNHVFSFVDSKEEK